MTVTATARYQFLLGKIEGLYERIQAGTLIETDQIGLDELTWPNLDEFVATLYRDRATFDAHFHAFKQPFDVFRAFTEADMVQDVGADWGYSALAMRHQGCRAEIVSIEATPFNIPPLARLTSIEGSNYSYVHAAADERPDLLTLYVPVLNSCAATGLASTGRTLKPKAAMELASRAAHFPPPQDGDVDDVRVVVHKVPALPIDSILETVAGGARRVAGVKMDIEGHEEAALKGAAHLFRTQKPLLMVEGGDRYPAVANVIRSYGYFYAARVDGRLVHHDGHPRTTDGFWIHPDMTAHYRELGIA